MIPITSSSVLDVVSKSAVNWLVSPPLFDFLNWLFGFDLLSCLESAGTWVPVPEGELFDVDTCSARTNWWSNPETWLQTEIRQLFSNGEMNPNSFTLVIPVSFFRVGVDTDSNGGGTSYRITFCSLVFGFLGFNNDSHMTVALLELIQHVIERQRLIYPVKQDRKLHMQQEVRV